jgi:RNA polymerase sigma factor (sigma-70 family)
MAELTDHELLGDFARTGAERAFAALVQRHINLVYSTARRFTGDDTLAADVTQAVFILLARKAGGISSRVVLTGWLYQAARLSAANALKQKIRRENREQEAYMQSTLSQNETDAAWKQIAPVLDDAMGALGETDRNAVLLRYFESKPLAEVGAALGVSEDAARVGETDRNAVLLRYFESKPLAEVGAALGVSEDAARVRVNRALEKLRGLLTKKGVTLGATAIAGAVTANAVTAAPVILASTLTTAVLTGTGLALTTVAMTTFQKIAVTAALALTIGGGLYAAKLTHDARREAAGLQSAQGPMQAQIQQLQDDLAGASNTIAGLKGELAKNRSNNDELLTLRGKVAVLKKQADDVSRMNRDLQKQTTNDSAMNPHTNAASVMQLHIKARFVTVPKGTLTGMETILNSQSSGDAGFAGIVTESNFPNAYAALIRSDGVEVIAEPEVTTGNGRQTQMRATSVITVITNMALLETNGSMAMVPQTETVETGPILDCTPTALADGRTIELPLTASVTDFLGYLTSTNGFGIRPAPAQNDETVGGQKISSQLVSPQFRVQQSTTKVNIPDNQTLVLKLSGQSGGSDTAVAGPAGEETGSLNFDRLVFVTATIVDAAGIRVNTSSEAGGN